MNVQLGNRLILEDGTKKFKILLNQEQPKNVWQYLDRRTVNI